MAKNWLLFEEAKKFAIKLNFTNRQQWLDYSKSPNKPNNIPSNPSQAYKDKGFTTWGDFLGNNNTASRIKEYLPYDEAIKIVHKLKLKTRLEYSDYSKSRDRNENIPSAPERAYKNSGWTSWGDWLGTERISNNKKQFLNFNEAKIFVRNLNLKNNKNWKEYSKSKERPDNIPSNPNVVYKSEWISMDDWLGTEKIDFLPFEEARNFVRKLNIKNNKEWRNYSIPSNIPSRPEREYNEWISWSDWLGTNTYNKSIIFLTYLEAKEFVAKLNLKSQIEWNDYIKSGKKPTNIPSGPASIYADSGWISWGDFLSNGNISQQIIGKEKKKEILYFINSIEPMLRYLEPSELVVIIQQANDGFFYERLSRNLKFKNILATTDEEEREELIEDLKEDFSNENYEESDTSLLDTNCVETEEEIVEKTDNKEIDALTATKNVVNQIDAFDKCDITASLDEEVVDFFIKRKINELWNLYLNNKLDKEQLKKKGGKYYEKIKLHFIEEHGSIKNWDWQKEIKNDTYKSKKTPNMMQKLFVKRVMQNKYYGNWSGTGAGKTIGTILATKILNCKNVIIITGNAIIDTWINEINECFSNNNILVKEKKPEFKQGMTNYLIYNYEFFQQPNSEGILASIIEENSIDFIALDEVQFTKQRYLDNSSKRKQLILKLLSTINQKNPGNYRVAMSATPVVNNLVEAKMLLELLTLKEYNDLDTRSTINNAIHIYKQLVINGIRFIPEYNIKIKEVYPEIDGEFLIETLSNIGKGKILQIENALLDIKLKSCSKYLKRGTIIYTHYIENMIEPIKHYIKNSGFSVGVFTGEDKSGKESFLNGEVDILIGSEAIGTGIDGLQNVCNNLIILSPPWTHASFNQLKGRIYRQGSKFGYVTIVIPRVNINFDFKNWSWDEIRMDRIDSKKELSDCAVDGCIPSDKMMSKETLLNKSINSLKEWKNKINGGDVRHINRNDILLTFDNIKIEKYRKKLGEFSELNKRWSTSSSNKTFKRLLENTEEWYYYHALYKKARKEWPEIPYIEISKKISNRPEWVIGDFGCGENLLSKEIKNKVYSFDYISIEEGVIQCDMSNVPLDNNILDVAVFSLSLMGSNYIDYLREGYRTLKPFGQLFICEPASKWAGRENELKNVIESVGFRCFGAIRNSDKFIYIDGVKYENNIIN